MTSDPSAATPGVIDVARALTDATCLTLLAQPIVDLRRGVVVGYEALSRFSLGRPVAPDQVFAAAHHAGLGAALDALVIRRGLALAQTLPPDCFLSINIDPMHATSPEIAAALAPRPDLTGLVIELTEHREIADLPGVTHALAALRHRGALIAIDDAGSGYSGLKRLLEIRPQLVKFDRELIRDVQDDEARRAVVQALGELADRLDAWVLAEGIETAAELDALLGLGVPLGQGYFLAPPAAPWTGLLPAAADALAKRAGSAKRDEGIAKLVEPCVVCVADAPWPDLDTLAVRVTTDGRPVALRTSPVQPQRAEHQMLRVKATTAVDDVARRMVARHPSTRWDPVVCIDERGSFAGIVRPERVVCELADPRDGARTDGILRH